MEFLINLTIKSTIILLFSSSALWLLRNASATLRHWVISLTMIGLLGLPLLLGILPVITVPVPYLPAKQTIETTIVTKTNEVHVSEQITPINKAKSKKEAPVVWKAENNAYHKHSINRKKSLL